MGALIRELRTAGIASGRVRGGEPAAGDALSAGSFQRFVVLVRLGIDRRFRRAGLAIHRIGYRAYAPTYQDAAALAGEIVEAVDNAGPRISPTGIAIHQTVEVDGGDAQKDPDTDQPYEIGVIELFASTHALAGS